MWQCLHAHVFVGNPTAQISLAAAGRRSGSKLLCCCGAAAGWQECASAWRPPLTPCRLHLSLSCAQVGGEVARRAKGLGMTVIAYDPYASEERAAAGAPPQLDANTRQHSWQLQQCLQPPSGVAWQLQQYAQPPGGVVWQSLRLPAAVSPATLPLKHMTPHPPCPPCTWRHTTPTHPLTHAPV